MGIWTPTIRLMTIIGNEWEFRPRLTWRIVEPTSMASLGSFLNPNIPHKSDFCSSIPRRHPQIIQEFLKIWLGVLLGMVYSKGFLGKSLYNIDPQQDREGADAYGIPKIKWDVENWAHQIPFGPQIHANPALPYLDVPGS